MEFYIPMINRRGTAVRVAIYGSEARAAIPKVYAKYVE
jgi:hypothetical protein